jgi:hypothetical protein
VRREQSHVSSRQICIGGRNPCKGPISGLEASLDFPRGGDYFAKAASLWYTELGFSGALRKAGRGLNGYQYIDNDGMHSLGA